MSLQPVAMGRTINVLTNYCYLVSKEAGWWEDKEGRPLQENPLVPPLKIALMMSELAEMLEGHRKGTMDSHLPSRTTLEVETADLFIRLMDFAGAYDLNLGDAVVEKMMYNLSRQDHTKQARDGKGGKKY